MYFTVAHSALGLIYGSGAAQETWLNLHPVKDCAHVLQIYALVPRKDLSRKVSTIEPIACLLRKLFENAFDVRIKYRS